MIIMIKRLSYDHNAAISATGAEIAVFPDADKLKIKIYVEPKKLKAYVRKNITHHN